MQRVALISSVCGAALAAQPRRQGHFMALQTDAPCSAHLYDGPSDYGKLCADIDAMCKGGADDISAKHNANLQELKDECERQRRILAGKEDVHAGEKADVADQEKVVAEERMDVSEARTKVRELEHCRPELVAAKEELATQEAIPNDSPSDIDAECEAKKLVMEKEQCVEELRSAERVMATQKSEHSDEKSDLAGEESEADAAGAKIPPHQRKVEIACAAYDDAKNRGPPQGGLDELNKRCADKRGGLVRQADAAIEDLLAEYLRQKKILGGKQDDHSDEKADVDQQEKAVAKEAQDVKEAKVAVAENAHCPPELVKAKAELATQEGIPNDTSEDIDAECAAKKAVMEAEQCVEVLRKAEAILARQDAQHGDEKRDLSGEQRDEDKAAAALPPQEKIVCELKAALDAARAARKTLPCGKNDEPAPAPAPEPKKEEPEKKSGAKATSVGLIAILLCALVQA